MCIVQKKDTFEYYATEHLRVSGAYWGIMAMDLMHSVHLMDKAAILDWLMSCQHKDGGFGGNVHHDPHMLYTLSAVQILAIFDAMDRIDVNQVARCTATTIPPHTHPRIKAAVRVLIVVCMCVCVYGGGVGGDLAFR
jgi:prenyltransferase beta subunit